MIAPATIVCLLLALVGETTFAFSISPRVHSTCSTQAISTSPNFFFFHDAFSKGSKPDSQRMPTAPLFYNTHDLWWDERSARNKAAARGLPLPESPVLDQTLPLDQISLEQVLIEFAESDYMATAFSYYGSRVMSRGKGLVFDMFEYAKCSPDAKIIELELKTPFDEGKKKYLERLSKYIRARFGIGGLQVFHLNVDGRDVY